MPLYDFECRECGQTFEELVRDQSRTVTCEHCGSGKVERKISSFRAAVTSSTPSPGGAGGGGCGSGSCGCH